MSLLKILKSYKKKKKSTSIHEMIFKKFDEINLQVIINELLLYLQIIFLCCILKFIFINFHLYLIVLIHLKDLKCKNN